MECGGRGCASLAKQVMMGMMIFFKLSREVTVYNRRVRQV
jgi:hypothetical protein